MISGARLRRLAGRIGTPLYVYDRQQIVECCRTLQRGLPRRFRVHYSIKANPNPDVCRAIRDEGLGAEIASAGELALALAAGFGARDIVVAGPGKIDDELREYVLAGVGVINVESVEEARRIDRIATVRQRKQRVALRVNPTSARVGARVKMGGKPSQFGVDEQNMAEVAVALTKLPGIELAGLHGYCGTQILDARQIVENTSYLIGLATKLARVVDRPLQVLDFGGGLGVPFSRDEPKLDVDSLAHGLAELVEGPLSCPELKEAACVLEVGRFLVAAAGVFVARIVDVKRSLGHTYVVVDGGINCNMAPSPLFRFDRKQPMVDLLRASVDEAEAGPEPVDVVGPLCTSLDVLARNVSLGSPTQGDFVVFQNAGAYGLTMSPVGFLTRDVAREVVVGTDGKLSIARRVLNTSVEAVDEKGYRD